MHTNHDHDKNLTSRLLGEVMNVLNKVNLPRAEKKQNKSAHDIQRKKRKSKMERIKRKSKISFRFVSFNRIYPCVSVK